MKDYYQNDCCEYINNVIKILNDIQIQLQAQAQVQEQIQKQLQEQAQLQAQLQAQHQDQEQNQHQKNTQSQSEIETEKSYIKNKSKSKTVIGDVGNHIKLKNSLEDESSIENSYLLVLLFLIAKGDKEAFKELKHCYPEAAKRLENCKSK